MFIPATRSTGVAEPMIELAEPATNRFLLAMNMICRLNDVHSGYPEYRSCRTDDRAGGAGD
jgi:hypothetical protein